MDKVLFPQPLGGTVAAISSKSHTQRLLIAAAFSDTPTKICCSQQSADLQATVRCLLALGAEITVTAEGYTVKNGKSPEAALLDCGESGTTLRFLLPVAAALGVDADFVMRGRLPQRPIEPLLCALREHGCTVTQPQPDKLCLRGKLTAGRFALSGNISSQFISGLLFALPLLSAPSALILTTPCESAGYVALTLGVLQAFGVSPAPLLHGWKIIPTAYRSVGAITPEGDWSNAAFWLCVGAVSRPITVQGLTLQSLQPDCEILSLLQRFGAEVTCCENAVTVAPAPLHGLSVDVRNIPDLAPPLALLAACAEGETLLSGVSRLRFKESDRLQTIADTLNSLGGRAEPLPDALRIFGGRPLHGGTVNAHGDHRIAMLAAVAASVCTAPVTVLDAASVAKSYPDFWQDYNALTKAD